MAASTRHTVTTNMYRCTVKHLLMELLVAIKMYSVISEISIDVCFRSVLKRYSLEIISQTWTEYFKVILTRIGCETIEVRL